LKFFEEIVIKLPDATLYAHQEALPLVVRGIPSPLVPCQPDKIPEKEEVNDEKTKQKKSSP